MKRIGLLGAYSIDNTGDQMLGYALRQAVAARVPDAEIVLLSPEFKGDYWGHDWTVKRGLGVEVRRVPADASTAWAKGLDAVIIGGGGLVQLRPDFRPFLLGEASDWPDGIPAAWNSVGAENAPAYLPDQRSTYRAVKRCCDALVYVSVRNETTMRFVRRCGFTGSLSVVPDPTMLMSLPASASDVANGILAEAKVDASAPVIGVSLGNGMRDGRATQFYKELLSALAGTAQIVVFPFGNVYGDAEVARAVVRALPGATLIDRPLTALERWSLVGALDLYVCTRYHAMLAAFAHDVPFVVLDEYLSDGGASSKIRDFVIATGLEGFYLSPFLSTQPRSRLTNVRALVSELGPTPFASSRATFQAELEAHYDQMIRALGFASGGSSTVHR